MTTSLLARGLARAFAYTRVNLARLGLLERAAILLFLASVVMAMATPTPLLLHMHPELSARVFPVPGSHESAFRVPPEHGGATLTSDQRFGCLNLQSIDGDTNVVCHRLMHCQTANSKDVGPSRMEVFKLPASNAYYVKTGSRCDSECCDVLGMSFSGDGKRLDDGILQRVYLRFDISGIIALLIGAFCTTRLLRGHGGRGSTIGTIGGFAIAVAMIWLAR